MTSLCSLTDDLLAEIFLHLPALNDVGRAAAACTAFRRVTADRAFLRLAHPAPLLGFLSGKSLLPAEPPHRSAPYAQALAQAADFSFSVVPPPPTAVGLRYPIDARDGRVLLNDGQDDGELVVCDPLHRQYLVLPEIPRSGSASPDVERSWHKRYQEVFLVPADEEEADASSFKVVYMKEWSPEPLAAFVFSSATGQWSRLAMDDIHGIPRLYEAHRRTPCYANGCFYWIFTTGDFRISSLFSDPDDDDEGNVDRLLVLDTRSMDFTTDLPPPGPGSAFRDLVIVGAEGGVIGMFTLHKSFRVSVLDSYIDYTIQGVDDEGSYNGWQPKRTVLTLPSLRDYTLRGATDRSVLAPAWAAKLGTDAKSLVGQLQVAGGV